MWDLSSLTRDQTCTPCIGRWSLNHWAPRKVPYFPLLNPGTLFPTWLPDSFFQNANWVSYLFLLSLLMKAQLSWKTTSKLLNIWDKGTPLLTFPLLSPSLGCSRSRPMPAGFSLCQPQAFAQAVPAAQKCLSSRDHWSNSSSFLLTQCVGCGLLQADSLTTPSLLSLGEVPLLWPLTVPSVSSFPLISLQNSCLFTCQSLPLQWEFSQDRCAVFHNGIPVLIVLLGM